MRYFLLVMMIFLGGCENVYRYPCQDPANWNVEFCSSKQCAADGHCTRDVLGPRSNVLDMEDPKPSKENNT